MGERGQGDGARGSKATTQRGSSGGGLVGQHEERVVRCSRVSSVFSPWQSQSEAADCRDLAIIKAQHLEPALNGTPL